MKAFVIRKWWRQLFVVAKQEQQAAQVAGSGECMVFAWRAHVARRHMRSARKRHVIKCKTLAAAVVQRAIKCHAARVALRAADAVAAAARKEKELRRALAYEVSGSVVCVHHQLRQRVTVHIACRCPASIARLQQRRTQPSACAASKRQPLSTGAFLHTPTPRQCFASISNRKPVMNVHPRATKLYLAGVFFRRHKQSAAAAAAIARREREGEQAAGLLERVWR